MFSKIRSCVFLLTFYITMTIVFSFGSCVAKGSITSDEAKKGIVRLYVGYVSNDEAEQKFYALKESSGCLVSNFDNNVYIVATYHDMNITKKEQKKFLKKKKLKKDNVTLSRKVVISDDMKSDVEIITTSENSDFCLLSVDDVLKEKVSLRFKKQETIKKKQEIYTLGYNSGNVKKIGGKIVDISEKNEDGIYIAHTAKISDESSGGALISEDGYFLGLNNAKYSKDGTYYSLDNEPIRELLDNRGIYYYSEEKDIEIAKLNKEIKKCEKYLSDKSYKAESREMLNEVLQEIKEELNGNESISCEELQNLQKKLKEGEHKLAKKTSKIFVFQIIIAVIDIVVLVYILIILFKNIKIKKMENEGKRNKYYEIDKNHLKEDKNKRNLTDVQQTDNNKIDNIGNTVKMSDYSKQKNTIVSGKQDYLFNQNFVAYLKRETDGKFIQINCESFIIGKNEEAVNYCILNNKAISRIHAGIQWQNGNYMLYDMGSVNGTYVNGTKLTDKPIVLNNGDKIVFANDIYKFVIVEKKK